jgi:hypothetical protein
MSYPTCHDCNRDACDWIEVGEARWEPDLKEVRPNVWKCWKCRGEKHPDMHEEVLEE